MSKILEIEKELNRLKNEVEELKKEEFKKSKDFQLYLEVSEDKSLLNIIFNDGDIFRNIGFIQKNMQEKGICFFITHTEQQENWEIWKDNDFKVAEQEEIEWENLFWEINEDFELRVDDGLTGSDVYNLKHKELFVDITSDRDFLEKDSENRIHLY